MDDETRHLAELGALEAICARRLETLNYMGALVDKLTDTEIKLEAARNVLGWYGEQARLCRLTHSEGDSGRHALAADGGKRAAAILAPTSTANIDKDTANG